MNRKTFQTGPFLAASKDELTRVLELLDALPLVQHRAGVDADGASDPGLKP